MSRSKERPRLSTPTAVAAETTMSTSQQNGRMYENEFSRQKTQETRDFQPSGKVFVPRVDIWTEILAPESGISSFWYYSLGGLAVCSLTASILDGSSSKDELVLARQLRQAALPAMALLIVCHLWAVILYPGVSLWRSLRPFSNSVTRRPFDIAWITVGALATLLYYVNCTAVVSYFRMPAFPALAITFEHTVVFLKMYAFVWWNIMHADSSADAPKDRQPQGPQLKNYLYFLCAPTLVYREIYPRTSKIRVGFLLRLLIEGSVAVFLVNRAVCFTILPAAKQWRLEYPAEQGSSWEGKKAFYVMMLRDLPAATFCSVATGFYLFRCVQNFAAELTMFADRAFQRIGSICNVIIVRLIRPSPDGNTPEDFWNCRTIRRAVALWNIPGHDWLYEHVYIPFYKAMPAAPPSRRRMYAALSVFVVSYIFHDLVISLTVREWSTSFVPFYALGCMHYFGIDRIETGIDWLERMKAPVIFLSLAMTMMCLTSNLFVRFGIDGADNWDDAVINVTDGIAEWFRRTVSE